MNFELKKHIERELLGNESLSWQPVGGGSINETFKLNSKSNQYFVKSNTTSVFKNGFYEEIHGLNFLKKHKALVPEVIVEGKFDNYVFLVLEWIETGNQSLKFWNSFAQQLAKLHQQKGTNFGLEIDNFMGELHQKNEFSINFIDFFIQNRLRPQVKLAYDSRLLSIHHLKYFESLYKQLKSIFPNEAPCAVHGDLWSGNFMCSTSEKAILIDPAVHYSHREVDLAMTTLFGGFSSEFYNSYQEIYPLERGFQQRKELYNLYPLLIHLNLFGTSYLKSIESIVSQF